MSPTFRDQAQGFDELLLQDGVALEFSRTSTPVRSLVDWDLRPSELDKHSLNFRERNFVRVEFPRSAMTPPPKAGEFFSTCNGDLFDIKAVTRSDLTYRCYCDVSERRER